MHDFRVNFPNARFLTGHRLREPFLTTRHAGGRLPDTPKLCADYEHCICFRGFRASDQMARERLMHELRVSFLSARLLKWPPITRTFSQYRSYWQSPPGNSQALLGLREL